MTTSSRPIGAQRGASRWIPALSLAVLLLLTGLTSNVAAQPRHPNIDEVVSACHQAQLAALTDPEPEFRDPLEVVRTCSQTIADDACRDATIASFTDIELLEPAVTTCQSSYCPLFPEPKPRLCGLDISVIEDETWMLLMDEFQTAQELLDLGPYMSSQVPNNANARAVVDGCVAGVLEGLDMNSRELAMAHELVTCAAIYTDEACRDSVLRNSDDPADLEVCWAAYCPVLTGSDPPGLCTAELATLSSEEFGELWAAFHHAVVAYEIGAALQTEMDLQLTMAIQMRILLGQDMYGLSPDQLGTQ